MGVILYRLKRYNEAILYFNKVLEKNSESVDALINKAHALFNLQRFYEAYPYYDKALELTTGYSLLKPTPR